MRLPIRLRLAIVFTVSMAVLLAVVGGFVYLRLAAELLHTIDAALLSEADAVASGIGQQGAAFSEPTARGLGIFAQVLGQGGRVLETSRTIPGGPVVPASVLSGIHGPTYVDRQVGGISGSARIVVVPQGSGRSRMWVVTGTSLQSMDGTALIVACAHAGGRAGGPRGGRGRGVDSRGRCAAPRGADEERGRCDIGVRPWPALADPR